MPAIVNCLELILATGWLGFLLHSSSLALLRSHSRHGLETRTDLVHPFFPEVLYHVLSGDCATETAIANGIAGVWYYKSSRTSTHLSAVVQIQFVSPSQ